MIAPRRLRLAGEVVVDYTTGTVTVDGEELGVFLAEDGPEVRRVGPEHAPELYEVRLPVLCDRVVTIGAPPQ